MSCVNMNLLQGTEAVDFFTEACDRILGVQSAPAAGNLRFFRRQMRRKKYRAARKRALPRAAFFGSVSGFPDTQRRLG